MKTAIKIKRISIALLTALLFFTASPSDAQFFTGGELSVTFVGGFNADIAPIVGYRFKNFSAGLSPVVMYTATGNTRGDVSYGGRIFAEYSFYKGIFAHAEFGAMNSGYINWEAGGIKQRNWVLSAPIGVGYEREITKNVWFKTMILYDALLDINLNQSSPMANPSIRGGITYTFN
jgi:hypothetical protein